MIFVRVQPKKRKREKIFMFWTLHSQPANANLIENKQMQKKKQIYHTEERCI